MRCALVLRGGVFAMASSLADGILKSQPLSAPRNDPHRVIR
jgi:hypothetical protein